MHVRVLQMHDINQGNQEDLAITGVGNGNTSRLEHTRADWDQVPSGQHQCLLLVPISDIQPHELSHSTGIMVTPGIDVVIEDFPINA